MTSAETSAERLTSTFAHQVADLRSESMVLDDQPQEETLEECIERAYQAWKKAVEEGRIIAD